MSQIGVRVKWCKTCHITYGQWRYIKRKYANKPWFQHYNHKHEWSYDPISQR